MILTVNTRHKGVKSLRTPYHAFTAVAGREHIHKFRAGRGGRGPVGVRNQGSRISTDCTPLQLLAEVLMTWAINASSTNRDTLATSLWRRISSLQNFLIHCTHIANCV